MAAHWKRIFDTCLAILLLSSCAAAPVIPTAGQPRPTLTARPSAIPYEPTAAVAATAEYELLASGGRASRSAPPGVDLDVTFISRDPLYYM